MAIVTVKCDRCGKDVKGLSFEGGSSGFFRVGGAPWHRFARPGEQIVCGNCMRQDPFRRDVVEPLLVIEEKDVPFIQGKFLLVSEMNEEEKKLYMEQLLAELHHLREQEREAHSLVSACEARIGKLALAGIRHPAVSIVERAPMIGIASDLFGFDIEGIDDGED